MKETIKIRDAAVECSVEGTEIYIPIKPFCELLGVDYPTQQLKVKEHPLMGQLYRLAHTVAADGKNREMTCLPALYFFGWLFSINANNVKEEKRNNLIKYQQECFAVLHAHFFARPMKLKEYNEMEAAAFAELEEANLTCALGKEMARKAKMKIEEIRVAKSDIDNQLKLF